MAGGAAAGRPLPPVHPGRRRHRRPRRAAVPPRRRGDAGDGRRARRAADPAGELPVQQPQADPGLLPRLGVPDVTAAIRTIDKLDKLPEQTSSPTCSCPTPARRPSRPRAASSWPRSGPPDTSFVDRVRALGVTDDLLDEGLAELAAVVEGCAAGDHDERHRRGEPADRPGARLLHRHCRRDLHGGLRTAQVRRRRRPVRRARHRRPYDVPRRRGLVRRLPRPRAIGRRRCARRRPLGPERRPRLRRRRGLPRARPTGRRRAPVAAAFRARSHRQPRSSASRSGTPTGAASRTCGSPPPPQTARTHEVKDIRSGNQVPADPATWKPPAEDLRPTIIGTVINEETDQ